VEASNAGTSPPPLPKKPSFADMGHQKLVDHVNEFDTYIPLFERAGFELRRFEIEVGLSPKFIPRFLIRRLISEEEKKQVMEEARSKHLLKMILEGLFKASYLSRHVKVGALEFLGLEIHVAAVPRVRLLFGDLRARWGHDVSLHGQDGHFSPGRRERSHRYFNIDSKTNSKRCPLIHGAIYFNLATIGFYHAIT